tara:strand:- start:8323 stop:8874 length:552 start_codon:yes stop_codon:yes gene_type:complete
MKIDLSDPNWTIDFFSDEKGNGKMIMPAQSSSEELLSKAYELAFSGGGYILVGAYDRLGTGGGSGFENVDDSIVDEFIRMLCGLDVTVENLTVRSMNVYLFDVKEVKSWDVTLFDKSQKKAVNLTIKSSEKPDSKTVFIKARNALRKDALIPESKMIDESDYEVSLSDVYNIDILDVKLASKT